MCPVQQQYRIGQLFAKHFPDLLNMRAGETQRTAFADAGCQNDYLGPVADKQLRSGQPPHVRKPVISTGPISAKAPLPLAATAKSELPGHRSSVC